MAGQSVTHRLDKIEGHLDTLDAANAVLTKLFSIGDLDVAALVMAVLDDYNQVIRRCEAGSYRSRVSELCRSWRFWALLCGLKGVVLSDPNSLDYRAARRDRCVR